jgi:hypothetical protein
VVVAALAAAPAAVYAITLDGRFSVAQGVAIRDGKALETGSSEDIRKRTCLLLDGIHRQFSTHSRAAELAHCL